MYPFKEGKLFTHYPPDKMPRFGAIKVSDAEVQFIEGVLKEPISLEGVRIFLKGQCNLQVVDDLSMRDILHAFAKYQTTIRPPVGEIAGLIYEKLKTLPEHKAMHIQEISNYLDDILDEVPPDNDTLRKRHISQLEPYGLEHKKRIGYCLR